MRIVLATGNSHKIGEILKIWGKVPFEVLSLRDFPDLKPAREDGKTFEENALRKAREVARQTGCIAISDDSGIEVEGLEGAPGVLSARYGGEGATDKENNRKLLNDLKTLPLDHPGRKARFRCVAALVDPDGFETTAEGIVEGRILPAPRGQNGFGYDPLFLLPDRGKTTAELDPDEKNAVSHRGEAFRKIKEIVLERYFLRPMKRIP